MTSLIYANIPIPIQISKDCLNTIVFESGEMFSEFITDFSDYLDKESNSFSLFDSDNCDLPLNDVVMVHNPLSLSLNDTKTTSKLYKELETIVYEHPAEYENFMASCAGFVDLILSNSPYLNVVSNSALKIQSFFKLMGIGFEYSEMTPKGKILEWIKIISSLVRVKIIVFVLLKEYFSLEDIKEIFEYALSQEVSLLLLERHEYKRIENEKVTLIDSSFCIIGY